MQNRQLLHISPRQSPPSAESSFLRLCFSSCVHAPGAGQNCLQNRRMKDSKSLTKEGYSEIPCGLDLSPSALKNKKLILIRHPKDMNVADVLKNKKVRVPDSGKVSEPILSSSECTNSMNYKVMMDEDPIHNTFRPILAGGVIGPSFSASMSIIRCVDGNDNDNDKVDISTPATNAYEKVDRVRGLRPSLLPLGSAITQQDLNDRIKKLEDLQESCVPLATPSKDKKKKRKSMEIEDPPTSSKKKKEKKSKKK